MNKTEKTFNYDDYDDNERPRARQLVHSHARNGGGERRSAWGTAPRTTALAAASAVVLLAVSAALWLLPAADDASAYWWNQPALLSPEPWSDTTISDDSVTLTGYAGQNPQAVIWVTVDGPSGP